MADDNNNMYSEHVVPNQYNNKPIVGVRCFANKIEISSAEREQRTSSEMKMRARSVNIAYNLCETYIFDINVHVRTSTYNVLHIIVYTIDLYEYILYYRY